jgi:hypothetical protein
MATPSVGSQDFLRLRGQVQGQGLESKIVTRPNVAGVAIKLLAEGPSPYQMIGTVDVVDAAAIETTMAALRAMQGTLQTVVDELGNSHDNQFVQKVERADSHFGKGWSGNLINITPGVDGYSLSVRFAMLPAGVPAP